MRLRLCDGLNQQYSYSFAMEKNVYGTAQDRVSGARKQKDKNIQRLQKLIVFTRRVFQNAAVAEVFEEVSFCNVRLFAILYVPRTMFVRVLFDSRPLRLAANPWWHTMLRPHAWRHGKIQLNIHYYCFYDIRFV